MNEQTVESGGSKGYYPLSRAQTRIWLEAQLRPDTLFYNIAHIFEIRGDLQLEFLRQALQSVVDRHAILRSIFTEREGTPVQVVLPKVSVSIPFIDLFGSSGQDPQRILDDEVKRQFDLTRNIPFRARIIRTAPQDYLLVFTVHHIASDHWSMNILYGELSAYYSGQVLNQPVALEPLDLQYHDYAAWEASSANGQVSRDQEYWSRRFEAGVPVLNLPHDRARNQETSYGGRIVRAELGPEVLTQLKNLAITTDSTLFMVLFSAFNVLLCKLTGQTELVVGTFLANRHQKNLMSLIGIFFNNLPVLSNLGGDPSFRQLVERIRGELLEAMSHPHFSYDQLLDELPIARVGGRAHMYTASFQLYYERSRQLSLPGLDIQQRRVVQDTLHDLMGYAQENKDGLRLWINFNSELFERESAKRILSYFVTLLKNIAHSPDSTISGLRVLTQEEERYLLEDFNNTIQRYPRDSTLIELFEKQVEALPESPIQVVSENGPITTATYAEMDAQATHLASRLVDRGVKPGEVVGILLEQPAAVLTAYLAVLKIGAVCLNLDVHYPRERIRYITKDSDVRFVIVASEIDSRRDLHRSITQISLTDEQPSASKHQSIFERRCPDDCAAVIYTSGSTARPKGVLLSHRGLVNQVYHRVRLLEVTPNDTLCVSLSSIFVTYPLQLFAALATGANLMLYESSVVRDPGTFFRRIEEDGVKVVEVTVSTLSAYLRSVVEYPKLRVPLHDLYFLVVAGEKLHATTAELFRQAYPHVTLINAYGQTECSGMTLSRVLPKHTPISSVTEGTPTSNNHIYILDDRMNPVPPGALGEIFVSGDGLALGYQHMPKRTAEMFVPHPFRPGERIYRTGDLGRMRTDGSVEVLGRRDDQVKLRGFLIEPAEIEAQMNSYPGIVASVVVPRVNAEGTQDALVAYYVASQPIDNKVLRYHLKNHLPDYMIPESTTWMNAFPRTPSGKIDKKALPPPCEHPVQPLSTEKLTDLESTLLSVWREILGLEHLTLHDDFFDIGGQSLQAIQVVARLHRLLGLELEPTVVFDHPTIAKLAASITVTEVL